MADKGSRKFTKVWRQGYIPFREVRRFTHYLSVPKRLDILMVNIGTSIGINSVLWATHFVSPTVISTLR